MQTEGDGRENQNSTQHLERKQKMMTTVSSDSKVLCKQIESAKFAQRRDNRN